MANRMQLVDTAYGETGGLKNATELIRTCLLDGEQMVRITVRFSASGVTDCASRAELLFFLEEGVAAHTTLLLWEYPSNWFADAVIAHKNHELAEFLATVGHALIQRVEACFPEGK